MNAMQMDEALFETLDEVQDEYDLEWDGPSLEQEQATPCPTCGGGATVAELEYRGEEMEGEMPSWIPHLKKVFDSGRLGWKAGRWIDKTTGRVFGKSISQKGAEYLYRILGRSRRAEDFVDRLPRQIRRWLYSL